MKNPFIYSNTNLRYHSYSYYLKQKYHQKTFKVPLDAGFTCPNRDGRCGVGGCKFCSSNGSGGFVTNRKDDLNRQFEEGLQVMKRKWPDGKAIAYFQAFSNTYASIDVLESLFVPFIERDDVIELAIATRPDCLDEQKIRYLADLGKYKTITVELGLQSCHDATMDALNRGHDFAALKSIVAMLKQTDLRICLHIINGLPGETKEMMLQTAREVAKMNVDGIKIHMLHILNDAPIYRDYLEGKVSLLTREAYVDIVISQLELLPPEMVIERLTGDAVKNKLIAPSWTEKKTIALNEIAKSMMKRETYQGRCYEAD